tara:strand:+ start:25819 stop:26037 length:219 start_codon:yes stop_codon:yes gene_type:complete
MTNDKADVHRVFHRDMHNMMLAATGAWMGGEFVFGLLSMDRRMLPILIIVMALLSVYIGKKKDKFMLIEGDY